MEQKSSRKVEATNAPRALYNELLRQYPVSDPKYKNRIITDSYLRLEQALNAPGGTTQTVTFNMLTNQGTGQQAQNVTETRLQMTDKFCASRVSIMIYQAQAASAATPATQAQIAVARLMTFPNGQVFTSAIAANMQALYNGYLNVTVDSTTYIQALDLMRFYRVPTSQQGIQVNTTGATGILSASGWDNSNYPFAELTPTITFSGIGKNQIVITVPNGIDLSNQATSTQNFVVCYLKGFLIQNVNQR